MENNKNKKTALIIGAILLIVILAVLGIKASRQTKPSTAPLSTYWTEGSPVAQSLRDYVAKVTDPKDTANFIPEKDRIAVFDLHLLRYDDVYRVLPERSSGKGVG